MKGIGLPRIPRSLVLVSVLALSSAGPCRSGFVASLGTNLPEQAEWVSFKANNPNNDGWASSFEGTTSRSGLLFSVSTGGLSPVQGNGFYFGMGSSGLSASFDATPVAGLSFGVWKNLYGGSWKSGNFTVSGFDATGNATQQSLTVPTTDNSSFTILATNGWTIARMSFQPGFSGGNATLRGAGGFQVLLVPAPPAAVLLAIGLAGLTPRMRAQSRRAVVRTAA